MAPGLSQTRRLAIFERDDYTCQDCGHKGESGNKPGNVQVHHIVPRALGGTNDKSNLITLCTVCHPKRDAAAHPGGKKRMTDNKPSRPVPTSFRIARTVLPYTEELLPLYSNNMAKIIEAAVTSLHCKRFGFSGKTEVTNE